MDTLSVKAHAKINWFLRILSRRSDGYHELDMLMQTISLHDSIELQKSDENRLFVNGLLDKDPKRNLIIKAADALSSYTGKRVTVDFYLTKRIPAMAGLGGGSSDCAATLTALNSLYELNLKSDELSRIALTLGADVPFFLTSGLCRVGGIGEKLIKISGAPMAHLALYHVPEGLSTAGVYSEFDAMDKSARDFDADLFLENLKESRFDRLTPRNDLEAPAIRLLPEIENVKNAFIGCGAQYCLMSGSGSAVYAVFKDKESAEAASKLIPGAFYAHTL